MNDKPTKDQNYLPNQSQAQNIPKDKPLERKYKPLNTQSKPIKVVPNLKQIRKLFNQCSKNPKEPNLYFVEGYGLCKEIN